MLDYVVVVFKCPQYLRKLVDENWQTFSRLQEISKLLTDFDRTDAIFGICRRIFRFRKSVNYGQKWVVLQFLPFRNS